MKKKYYLFLAVLFSINLAVVKAQFPAPAPVVQSLKTKYPDAANISWKNKPGTFQANFTSGGKNLKAMFDMSANWSETDEVLTQDAMPSVIKDSLAKSNYATWKVKEITKVDKPNNASTYKIFVTGSSVFKKKNLIYSDKGVLLKEVTTLGL